VDPQVKESVRQKIQAAIPLQYKNSDVVLVNANAGDLLPHRRWQKENFSQLIQKLLAAHPTLLILLTGSPSERAGVDEVATKVSAERCVNFAGKVSFEELPALYSLSKAIVTNDSGPAHFASAVGLKTFVLFGPETPRLYGPMSNSVSITAGLACSPCVSANNHRDTACKDNVCMKAISPGFVFEQMNDFLNGTRLTSRKAEILICHS
jgi:ADP-heptose:LPS heptosyltransferase